MATSGSFNMQDAVRICDSAGLEIGRGLANYPRDEVEKIRVSVIAHSSIMKASS